MGRLIVLHRGRGVLGVKTSPDAYGGIPYPHLDLGGGLIRSENEAQGEKGARSGESFEHEWSPAVSLFGHDRRSRIRIRARPSVTNP